MNNPTPSDTPEIVADAPAVAVAPVAPPPNDNRRRMRELLSVPERDRTDEQWDELIELEIQMAPGNRISGSEPNFGGGGGGKSSQGRSGGGGGHQKKNQNRPRNNPGGANAGANNPGGGSGGGGGNNNRRPRQNKPQGNPTT